MSDTYKGKPMRLGGGGQFVKLEDAFAHKGVKDPGAFAAAIGRKKLGQEHFQELAAKGLRRHYRENK